MNQGQPTTGDYRSTHQGTTTDRYEVTSIVRDAMSKIVAKPFPVVDSVQRSAARASAARHLISDVQVSLSAGKRPRAIDEVYDTLDPLLVAQRFEDAKAILFAIAQNRLPLAILLSTLTVTAPWRQWLGDARVAVANEAERLARLDGSEEKLRAVRRFI